MAKRRAAILLEDLYEELEFWYPYYRLQEAGFDVVIVAPRKGRTYASKHGYPATSEALPGEVDVEGLDILSVPGGFAPDRLRRYPEVLDLVARAARKGVVVGTICHAAWVAISAGITRGRRMTCVAAIKDDLVNSGATYVDEPLVVDGKIVSSRTPADLPVFVKGMLDAV